jgi:hypothetical protein
MKTIILKRELNASIILVPLKYLDVVLMERGSIGESAQQLGQLDTDRAPKAANFTEIISKRWRQ